MKGLIVIRIRGLSVVLRAGLLDIFVFKIGLVVLDIFGVGVVDVNDRD